MCGGYTITVPPTALERVFEVEVPLDLPPRYNVAPTQQVPVVLADSEKGRCLDFFRWGLVPHWAKDIKIGARLINARSETAAEKPSFKNALRSRRCLIVADGFYEWVASAEGKMPYWIHFENRRPFAFAGLWESWRSPEQDIIRSCTILTTRPNSLVEPIHDRMPVILDPSVYDEWTASEPLNAQRLEQLFEPFPIAGMTAVAVSRRVNNRRVDDERCIESVTQNL